MRSFFKLPGTALLAVAALFAVAAAPSTANALTFRTDAVPAAVQSGPETLEAVRFDWWNARRARHNVARSAYRDCRGTRNWHARRECNREARETVREMQIGARDAYRDCRGEGGNRWECRRAVWQYWVNQATGTSDPTDTAETDTGATDGGTDTGGGGVTDDLPM
jgi:hypothetical protein